MPPDHGDALARLRKNLPPITEMLFPLHRPGPDGGALWLLPAGWRSGERFRAYAQQVQVFDWSEFYAAYQGAAYFEWLREQLLAIADVVLIDSRTGVTEMGGVCARQLADVVVSFCGSNDQNVKGAQLMNESFLGAATHAARGAANRRPLEVVVVPARVDQQGEEAELSAFLQRFRELFGPVRPAPGVATDPVDLSIPYVTKYSYREKLVVGQPVRSEQMERAYERLATLLALYAPEGSAVRSRCAAAVRRVYRVAPRVCVTYDPGDGAPLAGRVREQLRSRDISVWEDVTGTPADTQVLINVVLEAIEHLVVVLTPAAEASDTIRRQVRTARRLGKCVSAIIGSSLPALPAWLRGVQFFPATQFEELSRHVGAACRATAVPFLAPARPDPVITRSLLPKIKEVLQRPRDEESDASRSAVIGLSGVAGTGKSALASQLCWDEDVQDAYPGGILWIVLGPQPDLPAELGRLYTALTGRTAPPSSRDVAADRLAKALAEKECLLVIDDVWDPAHLTPFLQGGARCTRLVTTRDTAVLANVTTLNFQVGWLDEAEAVQLLEAFPGPANPNLLAKLAERLYGWPLPLGLAGAVVQRRLAAGESPAAAWAAVGSLAEQRGLAAFDQLPATDRQHSLARSLGLTLDRLAPADRDRYQCLASLSSVASLDSVVKLLERAPAAAGGRAGTITAADMRRLVQQLVPLGLLSFDPGSTGVMVPAPCAAFLKDHGLLPQPRPTSAVAAPVPEAHDLDEANSILGGKIVAPAQVLVLAKRLQAHNEFGYARRLLARARRDPRAARDSDLRRALAQQQALCTYKDTELIARLRLDQALNFLQEVDDLATTRDQETLGLAGAIHKRKWELDAQKRHLERALAYYLRGYREGLSLDRGYTAINAAFVLDLLARQEEQEARAAGTTSTSAAARRQQARQVREAIVRELPELAQRAGREDLARDWWFLVTVAEAYFGLGRHDDAAEWLRTAGTMRPPDWQWESTARQLAALARLHEPPDHPDPGPTETTGTTDETPVWRVLRDFLQNDTAALRSTAVGKIGLALSGGGFRASLFHLGILARLAELDVLRSVEVLSCVSGGSVIGAQYYLEVRQLLQEKPDAEITREDYVAIVLRLEEQFLAGVQRNVRTRVAASFVNAARMLLQPAYSRTVRVGELYEEMLYARVDDGGGAQPRRMRELTIAPCDGPADFRPRYHNWRRRAKVPILVLNATALNTGHNWQFTATSMGEPPSGIDPEVDANDRLRRVAYRDAPLPHDAMRLGHAVAASACVPGLFEPLTLPDLYPERTVRLVDGGVHDNQGMQALLDEDCAVVLLSDASGQTQSEANPAAGILAVLGRSDAVLQARVRAAQYQDLQARRDGGLLRGLMAVHLKKGLPVEPVNWIGCKEPADGNDDGAARSPLTRYGMPRAIQQRLAAVRTDLDSFCDLEAFALMLGGYRMTRGELEAQAIPGIAADASQVPWRFRAVESAVDDSPGFQNAHKRLQQVLDVARHRAFKVWRLSRLLQVVAASVAIAMALAIYLGYWVFGDVKLIDHGEWQLQALLVALGVLALPVVALAASAAVLQARADEPLSPAERTARAIDELTRWAVLVVMLVAWVLLSWWSPWNDTAPDGRAPFTLAMGVAMLLRGLVALWCGLFVAGFAVVFLGTRLAGTPKPVSEILLGLALLLFGCFFAAVHLLIFDPLYLRLGRVAPPTDRDDRAP
jgi:predicted acylesterase/phospholipase RssA